VGHIQFILVVLAIQQQLKELGLSLSPHYLEVQEVRYSREILFFYNIQTVLTPTETPRLLF
jgi:hypothetical protein